MRTMRIAAPLLLALALLGPASLHAQEPLRQPEPSSFRPVRIAKWALLAGGAGAALYGLQQNQRADDAYERLEALCLEDADRCRQRTQDGAYADPALEQQYQVVRDYDGRARTSLLAGQLGVAGSAVLFIIDLRNARPPRNIPFEPSRIEVGVVPGGLGFRLR